MRNTFVRYYGGTFYFRILGYGLWFANYALCPPLFSERNGYRKTLRLPFINWRVAFLGRDR